MLMVVKLIVFLLILPLVEDSVYLYNTDDSLAVEFYDCLSDNSLIYCRRASEPIALQRDKLAEECYHDGTSHSFKSLLQNNVSISTVLHEWKSSIEKAEEYSRYIEQRQTNQPVSADEKYLCECNHTNSFGKNCEYLLPMGTTFLETLEWEVEMRMLYMSGTQLYGDIVCYTTLICNSGLLCLDWRDICDGIQHCMSGYDEENCDKLEFNECEDDEYRCMNGMCIPDEYFLDGDFDCLDLTDEKKSFDDAQCALQRASYECDDRMCFPNQWSCGDGQCISNRLNFYHRLQDTSGQCKSLRDQFHMCEINKYEGRWTLPNGKCARFGRYSETIIENRTTSEECIYFVKCALSGGAEINCPCKFNISCLNSIQNPCTDSIIQYPNGGIFAPYIFYYYETTRQWNETTPDYTIVNGIIKCRGYMFDGQRLIDRRFSFTLTSLEHALCMFMPNSSTLTNIGYHRFCHNNSRTFSNRPYHFIDICNKSNKCLSAYRINDGQIDCLFKEDESQNDLGLDTCSNVRRHRFRCSSKQPTCLSVTALGDLIRSCVNTYDEFWMGTSTKLSNLVCNSYSKDDCEFLRKYWKIPEEIEVNNNSYTQADLIKMPFRYYCDTFRNLKSMKDEDIDKCQKWWKCYEDQWQCRTGQCIEKIWVLDGEWDCSDASDEEAIFYSQNHISTHNIKFTNVKELKSNFDQLYNKQPFWRICNLTAEYPCFRTDTSDALNINRNRPCINLNQIGDGNIDCVGGIDERNNLSVFNLPFMLGYYFQCPSKERFVTYSLHCTAQCADSHIQCYGYNRTLSCSDSSDMTCLDGECVTGGWCNGTHECFHGEDEYMCVPEQYRQSISSGEFYRQNKQQYVKTLNRRPKVPQYPSGTTEIADVITFPPLIRPKRDTFFDDLPSSIAYVCNRGIGVHLHNGSFACFCPPQYYGDKCQFHSDRITVLFHLDLSQSIYAKSKNLETMLNLLIIFLYNNQTVMTQSFHLQLKNKITVSMKILHHLLYSRSNISTHEKRARYFNRSNIIEEHPYSVRIEAYELNLNEKVRLVAVWLYPIYFDFLPSFRLAKVLRLIKLDDSENPCQSNPCNRHQKCHPVLNQKLNHVCLCLANSTGNDCSIIDEMCQQGFCSPNALCKPNYRGLLSGNKQPYCICPLNTIGHRCDLVHDKCDSNPCQNGGTCLSTSKPDVFSCFCNDQYYGEECQFEKRAVHLHLNNSVKHRAAVVQYFDIDFSSQNLVLDNQYLYDNLPNSLHYLHEKDTAPGIIVVKIYSDMKSETYLIAVQINAKEINGTTELSEMTRCVQVQTLFKTQEEISLFKYHQLCIQNMSLLCFLDESYLCICDENHIRAECLGYDHNLDQCSSCFGGGQCLKNDSSSSDFLCLCPPCHSGTSCEFSSEHFSFTVDQLFSTSLGSKVSIEKQTTVIWLIFVSGFIFLFGLLNNICCFVTFRRSKCRQIGIGYYLLYMSVVNQINLTFLALRLTHLTLNSNNFRSNPLVDKVLCKLLNYLLIASSRIPYWLVSMISIGRVYTTLFLRGQWLNKPHIAKRLSMIILIVIPITGSYELHFVESYKTDIGAVCVLNFPSDQYIWISIHKIATVIHGFVPFFINICCTIIISCVIIKKKININVRTVGNQRLKVCELETSTQQGQETIKESQAEGVTDLSVVKEKSRLSLLRDVLIENKELIIGPGITLIPQLFSLPLLIISMAFACQDTGTSSIRYLLIVSYFTTFIPQLISFFLYISPSSFYTQEWNATKIRKWIQSLRPCHQQVPSTINTIASQMKDITKLDATISK